MAVKASSEHVPLFMKLSRTKITSCLQWLVLVVMIGFKTTFSFPVKSAMNVEGHPGTCLIMTQLCSWCVDTPR